MKFETIVQGRAGSLSILTGNRNPPTRDHDLPTGDRDPTTRTLTTRDPDLPTGDRDLPTSDRDLTTHDLPTRDHDQPTSDRDLTNHDLATRDRDLPTGDCDLTTRTLTTRDPDLPTRDRNLTTHDPPTPAHNQTSRDSHGAVVKSFHYQRDTGEATDGEFSIVTLDGGAFSILIEGRSYRVEPGAPGEWFVNGTPIAVELFDPRAFRERQGSASSQGRVNIAAPMPGKIVRVLVSNGDTIEAGQGLLVVEAMKMQNEMKSPKAGRVVEVRAKSGSSVAAGEVLMVVE